MSILRRNRILGDDVRRVIAHLKAHKKITAATSFPAQRWKKEKVLVKRFRGRMQSSLGPGRVTNLHRRTTRTWTYAKEHGKWKLVVVPENEVGNKLLTRRSYCEMDLIEGKGIDNAYSYTAIGTLCSCSHDRYKLRYSKQAEEVAKRLEEIMWKETSGAGYADQHRCSPNETSASRIARCSATDAKLELPNKWTKHTPEDVCKCPMQCSPNSSRKKLRRRLEVGDMRKDEKEISLSNQRTNVCTRLTRDVILLNKWRQPAQRWRKETNYCTTSLRTRDQLFGRLKRACS